MDYVKGAACHPGSVFPVAFDERVPDDHVCPVIEAFVTQLDLVEFECRHAEVCATGRPPWDPADLLTLYIYGYLHQTRSSRKLEPECQRTVDVMGLLARLAPDVKTLARVREANPKSVRRLCASCVPFCRRAAWVSGDGVAIEGSQCQAVARRKAVWTAQRLANEQARLAAEIGHSLDQPDGADESDETRFEGDAVRSARTLLDETGRPSVALTEPEAGSMRGTGPGDHVQRAVDADHHLIVHQEVTDDATDHRSLAPVAKGAKGVTGSPSMKVLADAGDANGQPLAPLEQSGIPPTVAPNRAINTQGDGTLFGAERFEYEAEQARYRCPAGHLLNRKQPHRQKTYVLDRAQASDGGGCPWPSHCPTRPHP